MAEYAIWKVTGGGVQKVLPSMEEQIDLENQDSRPDPAKVEEYVDEVFDIIVPGIKYRSHAVVILNRLKMDETINVTLKLMEKMDGGKMTCRDWVKGEQPEVEFDPTASAQAAAQGEPVEQESADGGKVKALTIITGNNYPKKRKRGAKN